MARVLLLVPTTTYRARAFLEAAGRLGLDVTIASEEASSVAGLNPSGLLTLDLSDPAAAARQAAVFAAQHPLAAAVPVDDRAVVAAAAVAQALGLRGNPVEAVAAARNKYLAREKLASGGVGQPRYRLCSLDDDLFRRANETEYPCVLKPLSLSASQGVMRADDPAQFLSAAGRLAAILARAGTQAARAGRPLPCREANARADAPLDLARHFLVEQFVAGPEFALEGLLRAGHLHTIAIFEKPDPLEGPFFEETIYITPPRLLPHAQEALVRCAQDAAGALGLVEGPVHVELRLNAAGARLIELNARSIGGYCSKVLRFAGGASLEEVILRHALDGHFRVPPRERGAAGVMMIPVPRAGVFEQAAGIDEARAVEGIDEVLISAHAGQFIEGLPESAHYLGFIFARGDTPERVEQALRASHARLRFDIRPLGR